jgi:predicted acylesterase/phospholipase RssA
VPLDDSEAVRDAGARLADSLSTLVGRVPLLHADDMRATLGDESSPLSRAVWREQIEATHAAVVYVGASRLDPWTDECVQQADLVVLVASARSSSELRPIEDELRRRQGPVTRRTELVLVHDPATTSPRGTWQWLAPREVDRHHHVRADRTSDYDRVARLLLGRGFGVVFSGGGARGIAHIGVLRALLERNIPIDATAGASIGAIVAGSVARGDGPDEVAALIHAAVVAKSPIDITFPSVSLAAGGRVTHHIMEGAQGVDVEDLWCNFFCVSTNLTRGALEIHDHGPSWAAVRSSFAVPALFPPMRNEAGDVLVDGGILDNLPVTPMRARHAGITVIAIDVGARREFMSESLPNTGVVSGWRFLASNLRQRTFENLTSLPRILMRLTELGSLGDDDRGDCYIRPLMEAVSLLDFDKFEELLEVGERDAGIALDQWLASGVLARP